MNSRRSFFGKLAVTIGAATAAAVVPPKLLAEEKKEEIPHPSIKDEPKYPLSDLDCPAGMKCLNGECQPITISSEGYLQGSGYRKGLYNDGTISPTYHIPEHAVNSYEHVHPDLKIKLTNPHPKHMSGAAMMTPDGQSVYIGTLQPGETVTIIGVPTEGEIYKENSGLKIRWYLKRDGEALKLLNGANIYKEFENKVVYASTMNVPAIPEFVVFDYKNFPLLDE